MLTDGQCMPRSAASLTSLGVQRAAGRFAHTSTVDCHHTDTVLHSRKKAIHCKQSHSAGHSGQLVLLLGVAGGGAWGGSEHVVQNVPVGLVWGGVNDEGRVFLNSLGVDPDGRLSRDWDMERQGEGGYIREGKMAEQVNVICSQTKSVYNDVVECYDDYYLANYLGMT